MEREARGATFDVRDYVFSDFLNHFQQRLLLELLPNGTAWIARIDVWWPPSYIEFLMRWRNSIQSRMAADIGMAQIARGFATPNVFVMTTQESASILVEVVYQN